jgi:hypothetical protein
VIAAPLAAVRHRQGRLIGRMEGLGLDLRSEAVLTTQADAVIKSGEIEGEDLNRQQVRSSIACRLRLLRARSRTLITTVAQISRPS